MSPTLFRAGGYWFFFYSREELRVHVHVQGTKGEAKIWIDPSVELAAIHGLSDRELRSVLAIVEERTDEIREAWREHFGA